MLWKSLPVERSSTKAVLVFHNQSSEVSHQVWSAQGINAAIFSFDFEF
jgi:hypothetical protein